MEHEQTENLPVADKFLTCVECCNQFTWSVGEQLFYTSKGLQTPRRCSECRLIRKLTIARNKGGEQNE